MAAPLLETKLHLPAPRRDLVPRPQLCERLERGAAAKLVLVSAPAGFGKTTLIAEWLATRAAESPDARPAAWLSLDHSDNQITTFWTYVIAAIQTVAPTVGVTARELLQSPQPAPAETVLTALLNDLAALSDAHLLVLDDYHVIDVPDVQTQVAFLLDHLPPQLHLVIVSRADPALPLARLRARGQLTEIRVAELRFPPGEAAAYLNGAMGLGLTEQEVAALDARAEGWIAALQLAALSMQGRDDIAGFIAEFAGDDRYIVDYLAEEVLNRQSAPVRDFLIRTSILDRLSGALCDAVVETAGSKAMLETLDRANLLLVPLDDRRQWYRYHHLFADVLRARLSDESPELVPALHRRASGWYAANGDRSAAVRHALAAEDFAMAADLVEEALPALLKDRQEGVLLDWCEQLPDDEVERRPVLANGYAGALLAAGEVEGVGRRLQDAEQALAALGDPTTSSRTGVVIDDPELRRVPAGIAVHRAGLALALGDRPGTRTHARRALEVLVDGDELNRGAATALIGLVSWADGDLETAHDAYTTCAGIMQRAGHVSDVLGCSIALADMRITQGRLTDAMSTYEQALRLARSPSGPPLRGTADMHVGMGSIHLERGDLEAARQALSASDELGEYNGLPQNRYRSRVVTARLLAADGNLTDAVLSLDEAERAYVGDFSPNVRPVPAMRARAWLRQGLLHEASGWVRSQGLSASDELSSLREYEHVTLVRVLLARFEREREEATRQQATDLLSRLLRAAEAGGRTGTVIEILVLQALAARLGGDQSAALRALEPALTLARPERYVRTFVDEGEPMTSLLAAAAQRGIAREYARTLIAAFGGSDARPRPTQQGLVEPLRDRELDVLRLLGTDLDGPEIARELVVSLHTVRTHTKHIYAKLGVNSRRAAVRRAEELDLTSRARDR